MPRVDPTALAGGGISRVTGRQFQLDNPAGSLDPGTDPTIEPTPIPEPTPLPEPTPNVYPVVQTAPNPGDTGWTPPDNYSAATPQSINDYWNAVEQYGYGNFGYNAQGNIVPYSPDSGQYVGSDVPNTYQQDVFSASQPDPNVAFQGQSADPFSGANAAGEASQSVGNVSAGADVNQSINDYWGAVQQYGYGNFGYDSQGNIVPNSQGDVQVELPQDLTNPEAVPPWSEPGSLPGNEGVVVQGQDPNATDLGAGGGRGGDGTVNLGATGKSGGGSLEFRIINGVPVYGRTNQTGGFVPFFSGIGAIGSTNTPTNLDTIFGTIYQGAGAGLDYLGGGAGGSPGMKNVINP